jgi:hypothetical protein
MECVRTGSVCGEWEHGVGKGMTLDVRERDTAGSREGANASVGVQDRARA